MQEDSRTSLNNAFLLAYNTRMKMERATNSFRECIQMLAACKQRSHCNNARQSKTSLYKTQMCHNIQTLGFCRFGSDCLFAHNMNELRSVPSNLPNTPQFSTASNVPVFEFESELFQHNRPCNSLSLTVNAAFGDQPSNMLNRSLVEEEFYKLTS
ncbi:hypothetical protein niasHT_036747 [Heterodera trifolii]|uniref:C3H1-type domain-containing protein n=1 Tax=Heterodera trifolii TaxID=157864 RepID=A0ABD2IUW4_9BILA